MEPAAPARCPARCPGLPAMTSTVPCYSVHKGNVSVSVAMEPAARCPLCRPTACDVEHAIV